MINHLITTFNHETGVAYVYFDYRQSNENIDNLLLSLLKQLIQIQPTLPDCVTGLYEQHKANGTRPSLETISLTLLSVMNTYSRNFIVIDALDECPNVNRCRMKFLAEIISLRNKSAANIFVTSRHNTDIAREFKGSNFMEVYATEEDVRKYLKGNMDQLPDVVRNDVELKNEVETAIVNSVQGMYDAIINILSPSMLNFLQVSSGSALS